MHKLLLYEVRTEKRQSLNVSRQIPIYALMYMCSRVYMLSCICALVYICARVNVHVYVCMYMSACTCGFMCPWICAFYNSNTIQCSRVNFHSAVNLSSVVFKNKNHHLARSDRVCVCVCVCMCGCVGACIRVRVYVALYVYIYVHLYIIKIINLANLYSTTPTKLLLVLYIKCIPKRFDKIKINKN